MIYQKYGSDSFRTREHGKLKEEKRGLEAGKNQTPKKMRKGTRG
jgi:hypothetical protein